MAYRGTANPTLPVDDYLAVHADRRNGGRVKLT